jgi:Mrp family chromosome partitioning ATPase
MPPVRRLWPILAGLLIGVAAAGGDIALTDKTYTASTRIIASVDSVPEANPNGLYALDQYVQSRVQSYAKLAHDPAVLNQTLKGASVGGNAAGLAAHITATAALNSSVVTVNVDWSNGRTAARVADEFTKNFKPFLLKAETTYRTSTNPTAPIVRLTSSNAIAPSSPTKPRTGLLIAAGLLGGLVLGLIVVIVRERLADRLETPQDLDGLSDLPVIAAIPKDRQARVKPVSFEQDPRSPRTEAIRHVRAGLLTQSGGTAPRIIAVTSPSGGEGRTTVAVNLAASLAEIGARVCLVEADLYQPSVNRTLRLSGALGLTSLLSGSSSKVEDVLQWTRSGIGVIAAGSPAANPGALLGSSGLRALLGTLATRFDFVVIDAPAVLPYAAGLEVVALSDAALIVTGVGSTDRAALGRVSRVVTATGVPAYLVVNLTAGQGWNEIGGKLGVTTGEGGPNDVEGLSMLFARNDQGRSRPRSDEAAEQSASTVPGSQRP